MSQQGLGGIRTVLEHLERRQRWTLIGWAVSLVAVIVLMAARQAFPVPGVFEAHGIKIVDREGRQAILIGFNAEDSPGIWFYRPGDKAWALQLGVANGTPGLNLQRGQSGIGIGYSHGLPGLWYRDYSGIQRVAVDFVAGAPEIVLYDVAKKVVWKTP
jgi:hypothetical protein